MFSYNQIRLPVIPRICSGLPPLHLLLWNLISQFSNLTATWCFTCTILWYLHSIKFYKNVYVCLFSTGLEVPEKKRTSFPTTLYSQQCLQNCLHIHTTNVHWAVKSGSNFSILGFIKIKDITFDIHSTNFHTKQEPHPTHQMLH